MFECLGRPNAGPNLIFDIFQFFFMPRLENQWLFKLHPNTGLGPILLEVGEILPISIKEVVQNLVYACASHAMVLFSPPPPFGGISMPEVVPCCCFCFFFPFSA